MDPLKTIQDKNGVGLTVEEAFVSAGGWGKFQTFLVTVVILAMNTAGLIEYGVVYLEYDPQYVCSYSPDTPREDYTSCSRDDVCGITGSDDIAPPNVFKWDINYDSIFSLHNFI